MHPRTKEFAEIPEASIPMTDMALFQRKMHELHTLFRFNLGGKPAISTTDISALKKMSKDPQKPAEMYQFLIPLMGNIVNHNTEQTEERRQFELDNISSALVEKNFDFFKKLLDTEIDEWLTTASEQDGIIAIQSQLKTLSMRMTLAWACGKDFFDSERLAQAFHNILAGLISLQYQPDAELKQKVEADIKYVQKTIAKFIAERKSLVHLEKDQRVYLDELIARSSDNQAISESIISILLAGYHTIAASTCWTLYQISQHPDVAKKLYTAIDGLLATKKNNVIEIKDLPNLSYLSKVIKETLRINAPGPYTVREASTDIEIEGYNIPKGTILFYPIWAVHMNPTHWSEPEKFDPDRKFNTKAYFPFGLGTRACTGQSIATTEVTLMVATLLQRLAFSPAPHFKPEPCDNFVLISKNEMRLKIALRAKPKQLFPGINKERAALLATVVTAGSLIYLFPDETKLLLAVAMVTIFLYYGSQYLGKNNSLFPQKNQNAQILPKDNSEQKRYTSLTI